VSTMALLHRRTPRIPVLQPKPEHVPTEPIEVTVAKRKLAENSKQAKEASQKLTTILIQNGISLRIYAATGGKH